MKPHTYIYMCIYYIYIIHLNNYLRVFIYTHIHISRHGITKIHRKKCISYSIKKNMFHDER